jgi:hypothetical protein
MSLDLRAAHLDVDAIAGNDVVIVVTVTDADGVAVNVSGYTIQADVYRAGTSVATFTDAVSGAGSNVITLTLSDAQTTTLGADSSSMQWSLRVTSGTETREWIAGRFRLYTVGAAGNTTTTAIALTAGSVSVSVSAIGPNPVTQTITNGVTTSAPSEDAVFDALALKQPLDADLTTIAAANNSAVLAATTASFTTADETKLDGIETGATADQTGAEILAALLTVDGAGSGLDADLLDGLSSTAFATAADLLVTISAQTGNYTLVLADAGKAVEVTSATPADVTVPPNSSEAFSVGTVIEVAQLGAGQVSIVAGSGVTVNSRGSLLDVAGQYGAVSLRKQATDTWLLVGDLV